MVRVRVEPGTHYAYLSGNCEVFTERFASPDLSIPESLKLTFLLSPRRLTLDHGIEADQSLVPSP